MKRSKVAKKVPCCHVCGFMSDSKSQIEHHHIEPVSMGGHKTAKYNLVSLCTMCHKRCYVKGCKGIHSKKYDDSIVIHKYVNGLSLLEISYCHSPDELHYI